jgi:hypothetical protein
MANSAFYGLIITFPATFALLYKKTGIDIFSPENEKYQNPQPGENNNAGNDRCRR